jgi:transcriptional regulator with XRE-family HTH domain
MELGRFIKEIRKDKNLTLREVAQRSGVSHPYLSQLENGRNDKPSPDILNKLANGLEIPNGTLMMAAGYIEYPLGDKPSKGNLIFQVPHMENVLNSDGVMENRALTGEEILKRFFDVDRLLNAEKSFNYKGVDFTDKDKQLIKSFLDALMNR